MPPDDALHPGDDWRPTASLAALGHRSRLLQTVRGFFAARGFLEVETPLASADAVVDRHLDPLGLVLPTDARRPEIGQRLWLQTSPEFAMKRLLAAGATAIYQVTRAFRADERGPLHNPEFTIVEWYRTGDDLAAGVELLSDLAEELFARGPAERLTYARAFRQFAGVDPLDASLDELVAAAQAGQVTLPAGGTLERDGLLDQLLSELVAPNLGRGRPVILTHYPASQAALARLADDDPRCAERFELFVDGLELANGYHELLDADELRRRAEANNAARLVDGKPELPSDSRLEAALRAGLPPCSGCALGFDRTMMVAFGASSIDEVIAFPIERA